MAEEIKAKVVETEEKSIQEKEEVVQKNSGFDEESQMYKVDLSKPKTDAILERKTEEIPVGDKPEVSREVDQEVRVSDTNDKEDSPIQVIEEITEEVKEKVEEVAETAAEVVE